VPHQAGVKDRVPAAVASSAAAVTVAWLSSFAGVAGTLAGIAAGTALTSVAVALYERWLRQANTAVAKRLHARGVADPWERYYRPASSARRLDIPWKRAGVLAAVALAVSLASVLGAEALAHKPVSAIVTGQHGSGCSVCGGTVAPAATTPPPAPTPTPTPTISPSPSVTTSPSPSPSPSVTTTPSPSPSATTTPSPSPAPSQPG
jgi:hypothetical protein